MDSRRATSGSLFEAINGGHLHWSDFRDNVLRAFRISCVPSPTVNDFPKPFLARLQAAQQDISKHDSQRQAWRVDVAAGRGLNSLAVFPPNLVPPKIESSQTLRCMLPRMSREGLPLRLPSAKSSLYELPTAKPVYVFGFDMDVFPKSEQVYLSGALSATGVSVDYLKGEVCPSRTLCCPFLAFERFTANNKRQIETARNSCAITGAQCLRGQQQLFHKAFGTQKTLQPLITFTCALNNEYAVINYHYIGEEGDYNMAALCKFDLEDDEHFNTFQAWIEAIDSWATTCLLPRIQDAISQVVHSHPTPPPSPSPTNSSLLSIDTKTSDVLSILNELRRLCPSQVWRNDSMMAETPINSSMAICGTPLPTREIRSLLLPQPSNSDLGPSDDDAEEPQSSVSRPPRSLSDMLSPLRTDLPPSSITRPRTLAQYRLMMSPSARTSFSPSTDSSTPVSPCRPPTLSPCTPGPDMPTSSMNPILVLQKRLDVAVTEIQELRVHADELQEQLNCRTALLERRLQSVSESQEDSEKSIRQYIDSLHLTRQELWTRPLDDTMEQEMKTPTACEPFSSREYDLPLTVEDTTIQPFNNMPGHYELTDCENDIIIWSSPQTRDFLIWCLAMLLKDDNFILQVTLLMSFAIVICCTSSIHTLLDFIANLVFVVSSNEHVRSTFLTWVGEVNLMVSAAVELQSQMEGQRGIVDGVCGGVCAAVCFDGNCNGCGDLEGQVGDVIMDRVVQVEM